MFRKGYSKPITTALLGGVFCASVAGVLAIRRYFVFKNLKEEIGSIPWDTKDVTWKHYFKPY